ncbi:hypothetical protein R3P38DRAFT_2802877 [Favolaschia claudopus]|uniref:Uncharacterized protein n=1 Tax=Favolaschia claudopus TaxID=2862362 RepID=A0AAV9ZVA0_9AGAR
MPESGVRFGRNGGLWVKTELTVLLGLHEDGVDVGVEHWPGDLNGKLADEAKLLRVDLASQSQVEREPQRRVEFAASGLFFGIASNPLLQQISAPDARDPLGGLARRAFLAFPGIIAVVCALGTVSNIIMEFNTGIYSSSMIYSEISTPGPCLKGPTLPYPHNFNPSEAPSFSGLAPQSRYSDASRSRQTCIFIASSESHLCCNECITRRLKLPIALQILLIAVDCDNGSPRDVWRVHGNNLKTSSSQVQGYETAAWGLDTPNLGYSSQKNNPDSGSEDFYCGDNLRK